MVAVLVGLGSGVQAQQMRSGVVGIGAGTIPGTPFGGAIDPSMVQVREGFQVIPSISVGQRYDSNVFFVPKRQGLDREDFVTTAVPQVRGYYVGNWFDVPATASAIGEYYAKHPTLNYVGANTGLVLSLSKLLDRWWQGATVLQRDLGGTSTASLLAPIGHLALLCKDRATALTLAYDLGVSPSFQFQAQALRTHVVSVTLTQQTAMPELLAVANVNYGYGDQFGSSASLSYATVMGTGGVVYKFSPETFLGLHYSYSNVDNQFNGNTFAFDRHVAQLSLTQAFY